jgi:flagellar basal-body rod protein FlgB
MINSNIYSYVDVLDKAADAAYTRNDILSNNIANVSTPNYKRKDVQFESILQASLSGGTGSLNEKITELDANLDELDSFVYTDHTSLSYRLDGNNVDIDQEEAYLAENQIRYQALVDQMDQEFGRYKTVLS